MENYIAFDVASEVSVVCAMSKSGRIILDCIPVPTAARSLREIVKSVPRPRKVAFEEGCQAAWLYSVLRPVSDDVLVCNPKKNKHLSGEQKSDKLDSFNLCDRLRTGTLKRVWHGGERVEGIKQLVHSYGELTEDSTRLKLRLKALFRSRGLKVSNALYDKQKQGEQIARLPLKEQRLRALYLADLLERVSEKRKEALKALVRLAQQDEMYKPVKSLPQFGPIFTSLFIATVCSPRRFRTREQFWSYSGYAVTTYESSEYELDQNGRARRKSRKIKTRGLVKDYNRTLKYIFSSAAYKLIRHEWKAHYGRIVLSGIKPVHARLTLTRKLAAIALRVAKTGELYDENLAFPAQKI